MASEEQRGKLVTAAAGGVDRIGDLLIKVVRRLHDGRNTILVVLPQRTSALTVETLLAFDGVVGILGNSDIFRGGEENARLLLTPRTDCWPDILPEARTLVVPEALGIVTWQWLRGAWRSGIGTVVTLEDDGRWRSTRTLWAFASQVLLRGMLKVAQKMVFGSGRLARTWSEKVGLVATSIGANRSTEIHAGKVLLVTSSLSAGGSERQVVHLANRLVDAGIDVSLLVQRLVAEEDRFFLKDLASTVSTFELPPMSEWALGNRDQASVGDGASDDFLGAAWMVRMLHPRSVDEVRRYLRFFLEKRPAVVHAWLDSTALAAGLAAVMAGVPRVFLGGRSLAPYRFSFYQPYFRPLYRALLSCPNVIMLNNSRAGLADYMRWLQVDEGQAQVVYNGIASVLEHPRLEDVRTWKSAHDLAGSGPVIGGVLRFSEEKDPLCWVEVAHRVLRRWPEGVAPPRFLMIGDGPLWEEAVAHAKRQGIFEHFVFLKRESRMALAMSAMDVLLLTSRDEGTPNVLIEAQALGLPVVTTDAGGCPETVLDGRTGWVVKAGDRDALAERVISALLEPEWRERARACAPAFIESRFGNRRLVEEMCRLYGIECASSH